MDSIRNFGCDFIPAPGVDVNGLQHRNKIAGIKKRGIRRVFFFAKKLMKKLIHSGNAEEFVLRDEAQGASSAKPART
jgi:hypothetical protein